ncbi:Serpin domain containing protein, partial [Asbolus verrucosus]
MSLRDWVSMTVVLPIDIEELVALEKQIDKIFIHCKYTRGKANLLLPKFRIESETVFKKILKNLGVHKVFKAKEADLSGIAGEKENLKVDVVRQKTFIDINEGEIEASASSAWFLYFQVFRLLQLKNSLQTIRLFFTLTSALATDRVLQEFINANNLFTAPVYK